MALETLDGVDEIDGFKIMKARPRDHTGSVDWIKFDEMRNKEPIFIDGRLNMISFKIQNGPIKEVGVNGCQVDTLIAAAMQIIVGLNAKFPSDYNYRTIGHLGEALRALRERKIDRENRGVEGQSKL
jgi:hypothetical protein